MIVSEFSGNFACAFRIFGDPKRGRCPSPSPAGDRSRAAVRSFELDGVLGRAPSEAEGATRNSKAANDSALIFKAH